MCVYNTYYRRFSDNYRFASVVRCGVRFKLVDNASCKTSRLVQTRAHVRTLTICQTTWAVSPLGNPSKSMIRCGRRELVRVMKYVVLNTSSHTRARNYILFSRYDSHYRPMLDRAGWFFLL